MFFIKNPGQPLRKKTLIKSLGHTRVGDSEDLANDAAPPKRWMRQVKRGKRCQFWGYMVKITIYSMRLTMNLL